MKVSIENGIFKCAFRQLALMTVWWVDIKEMEIGRPALKLVTVREDEGLSQVVVTGMHKRAEKNIFHGYRNQ